MAYGFTCYVNDHVQSIKMEYIIVFHYRLNVSRRFQRQVQLEAILRTKFEICTLHDTELLIQKAVKELRTILIYLIYLMTMKYAHKFVNLLPFSSLRSPGASEEVWTCR